MLSGNPSTTDLIHQKINQIETISSLIPAPMIIHRIPEFKVLYISDAGLELLGVSREEVVGLSVEDYQTKFFNPEDTKNYVPKLIAMINNNTDEVVSISTKCEPINRKFGIGIWGLHEFYCVNPQTIPCFP